jgi:hypothetical protein
MDHVEECPSYYVDCWGTICYCDYDHICMCRELRACEQRVREDERSNNFTPDDHANGMTEAYQRGLDAAREAVLHSHPFASQRGLAAIDALRKP